MNSSFELYHAGQSMYPNPHYVHEIQDVTISLTETLLSIYRKVSGGGNVYNAKRSDLMVDSIKCQYIGTSYRHGEKHWIDQQWRPFPILNPPPTHSCDATLYTPSTSHYGEPIEVLPTPNGTSPFNKRCSPLLLDYTGYPLLFKRPILTRHAIAPKLNNGTLLTEKVFFLMWNRLL